MALDEGKGMMRREEVREEIKMGKEKKGKVKFWYPELVTFQLMSVFKVPLILAFMEFTGGSSDVLSLSLLFHHLGGLPE